MKLPRWWVIAGVLLLGVPAAAQDQPAAPQKEAAPKEKTPNEKTPNEKTPAKKLNPLLENCLKPADTEETVVACTTAIESRQLQGDELAAALFRRGIIQGRRGQGPAAANDFSAALKQTPDATDVLYARAAIYGAMKRHDLAIGDYDHILKLVPNDPDSLNRRAWSKAALGRDEAAIDDLTALLKVSKDDVDALMDRGGLYLRQGKFAEAAGDFGAIVKLEPKSAAAFYNRGRAHFLKGDFKAAAKDFADAERLRDNNPYAALRRYLALGQGGTKADGKILDEVIAKFPADQWPLPVIATIRGQVAEKDLLAATTVRDPNVARRLAAEAHYYLGEAALLRKDTKAARAHFDAAKGGDRNLPEAIDAGWRQKQLP